MEKKTLILFVALLAMFFMLPVAADVDTPSSDTDIPSVTVSRPDGIICPRDDTCPITPFTDTDKNEWYHDGVHWAVEKDVMNGTSDNTFEPLTSTTRAMIVTMLWRMEGSPVVDSTLTFNDVLDGQWYTDAIRWAAANGLVNGYSQDEFGTNDTVTREQLATMLYRSAQSKGLGFKGTWAFPQNFEDTDQISEYAYEPLCWMTMNKIIQGMSETTINPKSDAVRAQVATILMRFEMLDSEKDPDDQTITPFLEMADYQNWAINEGYPSELLMAQGREGINQDYFHTPADSDNYSSGKIVIGDSRCCQMGIYEQRTGRNDFATFAVWGGHYAKGIDPVLMTESLQSEVEACFQQQIRTHGQCVIYFFSTVNDYDFTENENNNGYIKDAVSAAESIASMSYDYEGRTYHPEVIVIGFDGGPETGIVLRYPAEEFNRYCDDYNQKLRSAVGDSDILQGSLSSFTTVPEIVGGKASFITDGLHYSDDSLEKIIQHIVSR